ncbi:MAG: type IV secretion system DNA-binding domain-containing protein [Candidatus Sungbacteria bacterium]|nr:type IV secretion system DNA-binding domain-containing protein [Candidatus Sungbacteria bacterium]
MSSEDKEITYFAESNFRNQRRRFGIQRIDRRKHMYVIGKTGMGKTTLLENMAIQDIQSGRGLGIVDPHGEFAEKMISFVPKERLKDVIYFNPSDTSFPIAFNPMEKVGPEQRHLVASGLLGVFKKIWPDVWSARMEYLLGNAILSLLEVEGSTLLGINRMFAEKDFRKSIVNQLTDPVVKAFWTKEYASYQERFATEASAAIQNKVGQFVSNPLIRNIIGQADSSFDIRRVMDEQKILIMNLSKGKIGEENSRLLGAMLVTKIYLTAMTRVDIPNEEDRKDFYLYVDEFQNFATESFASILSEARKYRLNLILAHQYIAQMDETVQDAVFGNVGTMACFRVGAQDAELLEKEFGPEFMALDLVNLGFAQIYLKLMISGVASRPFSATTLAPYPLPKDANRDEIIAASREKYGLEHSKVVEKIVEYFGQGKKEEGQAVEEPEGEKHQRREEYRRDGEPKKKLFEAHCIVDGKVTMVPFEPDGRRPVYCQEHLEMLKQGTLPPPERSAAPRREERPQERKYEQSQQVLTRQEAPQRHEQSQIMPPKRHESEQSRQEVPRREERQEMPQRQERVEVLRTPASERSPAQRIEAPRRDVPPQKYEQQRSRPIPPPIRTSRPVVRQDTALRPLSLTDLPKREAPSAPRAKEDAGDEEEANVVKSVADTTDLKALLNKF